MKLEVPTKCNTHMPVHVSILNIEEHPWHNHPDTLEIIYVLKGSPTIKRSIYNSQLTAGDVSVVNPNIIHYITADEDNVILIFHFDVAYFESHFTNLYDMIFECDSSSHEGQEKHFDSLRKHLTNIFYDYLEQSSNNENSLLTNCISCLSVLTNHFCEWQQNDNTLIASNPYKKNPVQLDRLMRIVNYLYNNYQNKITLDDLAKSEYVSKYYISRIISEGLGMSFQTYINLIRVEIAQGYLYGTDWSINTISKKCGFSSPGFFRKTYEHYTGLTPLADRKNASEHTIYSAPIVDTDLSGTLSEKALCKLLRVPPHRIANHLSISKELEINPAEVAVTETATIRSNSCHCCLHLSSVSEILSPDTVDMIHIIKEYNCANTVSVDCSTLKETFSYLGSWDFLMPLLSILDSNSMNLMIINNTDSDCQTDDIYRNLSAYLQDNKHAQLPIIIPEEIFRSEKDTSLIYVSRAIKSDTKFNVLPLFANSNNKTALFTHGNIKSPYFYAFFALNRLGDEILEECEDYLITRHNDSLTILILNHASEASNSEHRNFMFTLKNLKRDYICFIYNITANSGNESVIAESLNTDSQLSSQVKALIDRKSFPEFNISSIDASPEYNLYVASPAETITLIELL